MIKILRRLKSLFRFPPVMTLRFDVGPKLDPAKTVIFLHGIAASYKTFRPTLSQITLDPDFKHTRLMAFDLIGFGRSKRPRNWPYDFESYRKVLRKTFQKYHIRGPVIIVGHSMGCLIAADFAQDQKIHKRRLQVESLILVSPPVFRPKDTQYLPDRFLIKSYRDIARHSSNSAVQTIAAFASHISSFENRNFNTPAFRRSMEQLIISPATWRTLSKIRIPTTIIHGLADPLVIGQNLEALAKRSRHIEYITCLGAHDILGAKQRKLIQTIKAKL